MKKNAGKTVKLLIIAVIAAVIAGALGVITSADDEKTDYTVTRYLGVKYSLPRVTAANDYDSASNSYRFSDPSMVLINGKTITERSIIYPNDTVEYIKTGELKMYHHWRYYDGTVDGNFDGSNSSSNSYTITVKEKEAFKGDIKITYDEPFVAGKPFPELKVESNGDGAKFLRAWFEISAAGTHHDEIIPDYYAGVEAEIKVELEPTDPYYFGWVDDGEPYWSPALSNVTVNGKKVDASVFTYKKGNTLFFYFPVTIGGEAKEIEITDLDVPTHGQPLDRTATASVGTVTKVRYEMLRKEINEVSKGDNISVGVQVKLPKGFTFADGSYAVWNGQTSEYRIRTSSMGSDEYLYVFPVTVGVFSEQAYINSGSVFFSGDAMLKVGARVPDRNYIDSDDNGIIYGDPIWTPADKTFKSGTTYTVKIPIELEPEYVWTDDIETNYSFSIESKDAVLVIEGESTGGKPKFETKKYITATFTPEDIEGQTAETNEGQHTNNYFDLELSYSKTSYDLKVGDNAAVTVTTNIDSTLATNLKIQWYKSTSSAYGSGVPVSGAKSLTLNIPTDKAGTTYYYCEVSCELMGEKSKLTTIPDSVIVKVTEKNSGGSTSGGSTSGGSTSGGSTSGGSTSGGSTSGGSTSGGSTSGGSTSGGSTSGGSTSDGSGKLKYDEKTNQHVIVYSSKEKFSFKVNTKNFSPNVSLKWYECNKDGKINKDTILASGKSLTISGIKDENMYRTFYYKCVANDNGDEHSLVFSCLLLPKNKALPFKDVIPGDPYYGSVWYANNHDPLLMNGVSADSFDPKGNLTRAAIVTVLYRLEGSPATAAASEFNDVPANQWYSDAVAWAVKYGITNGYGDGRFGPDDPITREQLAVFLYRYAKSRNIIVPAYGKLLQSDASKIDSWALDAMTWAYSKGIIEEVEGVLAPVDKALRHMIATALTRFCVSYSM